jgi:hypothetical protein
MNYQSPRVTRRESRTPAGRFRAGVLAPAMAVAVRPSEGGLLAQSATLELDPIAGRLLTAVYGEMVSVFVPVPAIDAIKDPAAAYAGMTEVIRQKLLTGNPLFGLEDEGEISKRCDVEPVSIGGAKKVNEMVRLAHNAAVNFLRQRKYHKATKVLHSNTAVTPALLSSTVLERFNGVLDPDDRINGSIQLDIPNMQLPVSGIVAQGNVSGNAFGGGLSMRGATSAQDYTSVSGDTQNFASTNLGVKMAGTGGTARPDVFASLNGVAAGSLSAVDFYNAQTMDRLTRTMGEMVEADPEFGEENVLRWAHGLNLETGKIPFIIHESRQQFGRTIVPAMDSAGVTADTMRSDMMMQINFSVPVPKTELGGIVITFLTLKPEETLASQPHPILSEPWGLDNFVADELALDPVPVTYRQLDSGVASGSENTVAFYTGLNAMKQNYVRWGFNRHLNPATVAAKSSIWQLTVPLSVTPDSVLYPENISQYPFADQLAEVCQYTIASTHAFASPMIMGPSPVETLPIINSADLFEVLP